MKRRNGGELSARKTKKRAKAIGGGTGVYVRKKGKQVLKRFRKNPKSIRLKDFTGTVRLNPDRTVSVLGRAKRKGC